MTLNYATQKKYQFTVIFALILFIYSCGENSKSGNNRQIETNDIAESSDAAGTFYAVCEEKIPLGSRGPLGWCGPKRTIYTDVKKDTADHNLTYPSHKSSICSGVCPTCD
jgi:hypothetical protein